MIHVKGFQNLESLERKLNELDKNSLGDRGDLERKFINLQAGSDENGWYAVLVWRD